MAELYRSIGILVDKQHTQKTFHSNDIDYREKPHYTGALLPSFYLVVLCTFKERQKTMNRTYHHAESTHLEQKWLLELTWNKKSKHK
jgi:hypothetical protein